jgi:hypothetical protein
MYMIANGVQPRPARLLSPAPRSPLSRRHFVRSATGAIAAGAALTSGLWTPLSAKEREHDPANPVPIPIGSFGFHVNAPAFLDPVDADPSTITDFKGFMVELPFLSSDMRFMQSEYRGFDGRGGHVRVHMTKLSHAIIVFLGLASTERR